MSTWTDQAGYPVIYVKTNRDVNSLIVTQVCNYKI